MRDIFGPQGIIAETLAGYECRQGQMLMAEAIAKVLDEDHRGLGAKHGEMLLVEAGTGIGKTLAYLVPAAFSGRKVIISTGTLNLQDQILHKEIPFIQKHIDPSLTALCVKGRQNYLCLHRWYQLTASPQIKLFAAPQEIDIINRWLDETTTGDRAELEWLPDESPLWRSITSTTSQCLGIHCPELASCFITKLRKEAAQARLLIVNHHLFFSDLALRRFGNAEVLPRYESVIFDEAHHIENIATRYFGTSFSHYQILDLTQDIETLALNNLPKSDQDKTIQLSRALATQADLFAASFPTETGRFPLREIIDRMPSWSTAVETLAGRLNGLAVHLEKLLLTGDLWSAMLRRCEELISNLTTISEQHDSSYVYWLERRERTVLLSASPIEIAPDLQKFFYEQVASAVFTSATMTTNNKFSYVRDRLGLPPDTETLALPTPFNYQERTMLYVPPDHFPLPASPHYPEAVQKEMAQIILAASGRTLALFTSVKAMKNCYDYLATILPYPVLVQGDAPKSVLLAEFKRKTHSVLMAVASFWEGVDVPGEALSCVIIDKLPFEVPSDPIIMARIKKIEEDGGKPFFDFQVPRAVLTLRQGIGRLMRTSSDHGLLAIMDVRLFAKSYGRTFLTSLPPSPVTRSLDDVRAFFKN
ncbi:MAG: ATP-dependent DNA helicase [Proteobacteria bacterium]|nr:ATP-dependent DNA helicase [Pseudomonadota bacterium]MBU1713990.1 ATP-dependent DNA helicase [Pseudomonadota bacterium]